MSVRFPEHPTNLEDNQCYRYLLTSYTCLDPRKRVTRWLESDLVKRFTQFETKKVINRGILTAHQDGTTEPSFLIPGSASSWVLKHCTGAYLLFPELLKAVQLSHPYPKIDAIKLKDLVAFLRDFHQLQYMSLPASGVTLLTIDSGDPTSDKDLDFVYQLSDLLEH